MQQPFHQVTIQKILLLVNPKSRYGAQVFEQIKNWLEQEGYSLLNDTPQEASLEASILLEKYASQKPLVLVAGGDGSVNSALPQLLQHQLTLLLVPSGTANNLARTLKIPTDIEQALSILKKHELKFIDVGLVNEIPFINVVGLGLGTQVNRVVRADLKRWLGVWAFVWTAFKVALRMTPFKVTIECDQDKQTRKTWQVSICNGRNYGNGLVAHEDATLFDQTLHGLSTEPQKWWHVFVLIPSLLTGKFQKESDITSFQGKHIRLTTKRPMSVDVDGDIKTKTPLSISVLPQALRILVPPAEEEA